MTVLSLFGGPGGWCEGARQLDIHPIGIEVDADACATRRAAGHATIRADLHEYEPPRATIEGIIASPPCPAFSAAGNGHGRAELPDMCAWVDAGEPDTGLIPDGVGGFSTDALLLATPLGWIAAHDPKWIAMEQVPPVLPFWQATARWLNNRGYHTWAGILCAADYGVPQQRYRAFLLANRDRPAHPPEPTHAEHTQGTLFGPERAPWTTMAEALDLDASITVDSGQDWKRRDGSKVRYRRSADRASSTVTTKSVDQWVLNQHQHGDRTSDLEQPSPTITAGCRNWAFERPATTVQGDSRIWPPGHRINQADINRLGETQARARYRDRAGSDAIKVEPWQAGVLQGFPPDYPWQGTKTSQAQQIGNAVPPPLAAQILGSLAGCTVAVAEENAA